jgi:hypothetical protein
LTSRTCSGGVRPLVRAQIENRLARIERLHVDVDVGTQRLRAAKQRKQSSGGIATTQLRRVGPQQRRERGDLDRNVRPRQLPDAVAL